VLLLANEELLAGREPLFACSDPVVRIEELTELRNL
jgi:hypothetical protein